MKDAKPAVKRSPRLPVFGKKPSETRTFQDVDPRRFETEVHTYDWRTRQNLKQNRGR